MCNDPRFYPNIINPWTGKMYPVACHTCQGCRIDRQIMWQRRCAAEFIKYRSAFVTLTYDKYNLTYKKGAVLPTINHEDFSKYIEAVRQKVKRIEEMPKLCTKKFHFAAAEEYGERRKRPHFHIVFFGLDYRDFYEILRNSWENGIADIGPIMRGGINYVLSYINSEQRGEYAKIRYTDNGLEIPKMHFSQGIGKEWFISQTENICKYGMAKEGNRLIPIPTYWKNKLFIFNDKNIETVQKHALEYAKTLDETAKAMGYFDYSEYLRGARKALEYSKEKENLKRKIPSYMLSHQIPDFKLSPFNELATQYQESPIMAFLDRIQKIA